MGWWSWGGLRGVENLPQVKDRGRIFASNTITNSFNIITSSLNTNSSIPIPWQASAARLQLPKQIACFDFLRLIRVDVGFHRRRTPAARSEASLERRPGRRQSLTSPSSPSSFFHSTTPPLLNTTTPPPRRQNTSSISSEGFSPRQRRPRVISGRSRLPVVAVADSTGVKIRLRSVFISPDTFRPGETVESPLHRWR
ncbi:hypothetical protein BCR34DRAFT_555854 [Clohesyomyces aquaticus]|uniref:Uncharacterized protein n=1 Tax=Clohesyomyces aquaticus TaxID=1231657 RepID=A0A1Y2A4U1_9PLEO|nr:hypothetical protein BCR34DRAFT_555854 [Clohesyomyces aquaticus]